MDKWDIGGLGKVKHWRTKEDRERNGNTWEDMGGYRRTFVAAVLAAAALAAEALVAAVIGVRAAAVLAAAALAAATLATGALLGAVLAVLAAAVERLAPNENPTARDVRVQHQVAFPALWPAGRQVIVLLALSQVVLEQGPTICIGPAAPASTPCQGCHQGRRWAPALELGGMRRRRWDEAAVVGGRRHRRCR